MNKLIIFLTLRVGIRAYYIACVPSQDFSDLLAVPQYINAASKNNFRKVSFYSLYFNEGIIGIISWRKQKERERENICNQVGKLHLLPLLKAVVTKGNEGWKQHQNSWLLYYSSLNIFLSYASSKRNMIL